MKCRYAVVIVGYNRLESLKRVVQSVENADYGDDEVDLIFDLDNPGHDNLLKYAEEYEWRHGKKKVKFYPKRLGLRAHMIEVGEELNIYDAIAVLEDDVYVSTQFYKYMKQTVSFYQDDNEIFGISLYAKRTNHTVTRPFHPMVSGNDVYFQQDPISWGQIWLKKQWFAFKEWYFSDSSKNEDVALVPTQVLQLPETSYLKYLTKYLAANDKYFVMPYKAYSTCFADCGEHTVASDNSLQLPLVYEQLGDIQLVALRDCKEVYDCFYENKRLCEKLQIEDVCIDLYDNKRNEARNRFWLTTGIYDYRVVRSFGLVMKPHEMNVILGIDGEQIFLYDTCEEVANKRKKRLYEEALYDVGTQAQQFYFVKRLFVGKILEKILLLWKR